MQSTVRLGNSNEYSSVNRDAVADGDDKGRGESSSGSIGTLTDINEREKLLAKNGYNENRFYSTVNRNDLSDGDEKGKGDIGNKTDVEERSKLIAVNNY